MSSQEIVEKYRKELLNQLFKKKEWLSETYGVDLIALDEIIELKCGESWGQTLAGVAKALEYVCNICIKSGDV